MKKRTHSIFKHFVIQNIPWLILVLVVLTVSGAVRTYSASYIIKITDAIASHAAVETVFYLASIGFLFIGSSYLFRYLGAVLCMWMTEKLAYETRLKIVTHLQKIPFVQYEKLDVGNLQSVLRNDVKMASNLIYNLFSRIMQNILLFFMTLWFMATIHLPMALIVSSLSIAMTILNQKILVPLKKHEKRTRVAVGDVSSTVLSGCGGMTTIKTYKAYDYIFSQFKRGKENYNRSSYSSEKIDAGRLIVYNIANNCSIYLAILFFSYKSIQGEISVGEVIVFITLLRQIMIPVEVIFRWMSKIVTSSAAWDRIYEVLDLPEETASPNLVADPGEQMDIRDLTFFYEPGKAILNHLHLCLRKGEIHAVSGQSGSGKTTLYKVLLGLYHAQGAMVMDQGRESALDVSSLAAFVPANVTLFDMSIYENLVFDNTAITREECLTLAQTLGTRAWLESLPDGLDTSVVAGGSNFSGGQRQILGAMRAFLSGKPIWILDEVFSALDVEKREKLWQYLQDQKGKHFILLTTHNPEITVKCDRITAL